MANPLPPGAIPKLYRLRNKTGAEIGAWYVKIDKKPVNLRTQDYMKARERAKLALQGKRDFTDDRYFDETPQGPTPKVEAPPVSDDWTMDAHRAATQSAEPESESTSSEYFPPGQAPPPDPPPPTDAPPVNTETPKSDDAGSTQIPPEMIEGIVKQIAAMTVELQLHGQEYLWLRWAKIQPGFVPLESDARKVPQELWERQWKKWIPTDVPIPEWAAALILTAFMGGMVQFQGASPLPKPPETVAGP
jgi:hypothetical protein